MYSTDRRDDHLPIETRPFKKELRMDTIGLICPAVAWYKRVPDRSPPYISDRFKKGR